ncbi:trehalose-phosphatase [Hydrogenophaga laconesensis]|uniref:Trehalose 6-phosphate phosphatase n=1 Tax=Hydrogenophaga laconesensis TaxID=1805971 RepID=A0ABU1V772_9BURK|nr:trehalose-phosphatase [Hydrogenophaga laconesensis]MDR7093272.1 trehalose 6-phosphate phosphatase [Hydrogenophaga laconesensis]
MSTLPRLLTDRTALFLDFDGTLADLAGRPDAVQIHPELRTLLDRLHARLDGALALVTGRSREDLEPMLASPWPWPAAFEHGAVRLSPRGGSASARPGGLARAIAAAEQLVAGHGGLLLERKQTSMALHYRQAPMLEALCMSTLQQAIANEPGLQLLRGKAVVEVKSARVSKGAAIEAFMQEVPFAGRTPVFAGDDVTDEAGFEVVQRLGGEGIKVGNGPTHARHRCPDPQALRAWLSDALSLSNTAT